MSEHVLMEKHVLLEKSAGVLTLTLPNVVDAEPKHIRNSSAPQVGADTTVSLPENR